MLMKIIHRYDLGLSISNRPKCGDNPIGSFISGMFGIGSTAMTNDTNEAIADKQIAMQKEENQKNRDYNTLEAEKTRQFAADQADIQRQYNTQERLAQQQFETDQWNQQFERSNRDAYALQVEGARQAGLNPNVLFGSGTSAAGTSSVGAPSGSGGTSPASGPMASYNNGLSPVPFQAISPAVAFQQVAQGFSSLANAKKAGADVDKIYQEIDNLTTEKSLKEVMKQGVQLTNALSRVKLTYAEKREILELANLAEQNILTTAQGKVATNQAAMYKAMEKVQNALADKHGQEYELLKADVTTYFKRLDSMMKLQGAQTRQANAEAALAGVRRSGQEFENAILKIDSQQAATTALDKLEALRAEYKKSAAVSVAQRNKADVEAAKLEKIIKMYQDHPNKAALDAALDNFNEHFPIIGGFIKAFAK